MDCAFSMLEDSPKEITVFSNGTSVSPQYKLTFSVSRILETHIINFKFSSWHLSRVVDTSQPLSF